MRHTKMALPAAVLFLSILSVPACSPRPNQPDAAQPMAATSGPALETFYVPAQHANKGRAEEPVKEFY